MKESSYSLAVSDEALQATAEHIGVWNFAKKARKVITVLKGTLEKEKGEDIGEISERLNQAMKYAGVSFSQKEKLAFRKLISQKPDSP